MRYLYCIVALLLSVLTASAKPISREQARLKAIEFMKEHDFRQALAPVTSLKKLAPRKFSQIAMATDAYYVFNKGTEEGYVIVSGDDQTISVLGYCDNGEFDYDNLPPNMREWLDDYARQIEYLQRTDAPIIRDVIPTHPRVEQLLKSKWGQGDPFNLTCPLYFDNRRSVTGCVATAMAQLLYFNREKSVTETQGAMPAYDTYTQHATYGSLHVEGIPAGSTIDWEHMRDEYGSSATDIQRKAVADLMHYCGVGAKMDYTSSSSGAQSHDAYLAIVNYFGYGSATKYVSYSSVSSDTEWDDIVYREIAAHRPIYISGANADVGHAFVADGYDGERRYHINWGWNGQSDGYYYLTNLTPGDGQGIGGSADGYNGYREIIIGLEPENFGDKTMTISDATVKKLCLANWDADGDQKLTYNEAAAVTDLGSVFSGQKTIKNFQELYYFTGLSKIGDEAFNGCTSLINIRLPKNVKEIGARGFAGCSKLQRLDLPAGLTVFGEEAFSGCSVLKELTLPEGMLSIENGTFKNCAAITSVNLPVSVEKIGDEAFSGCKKLTEFRVNTFLPSQLVLGTNVFSDISLSQVTLIVKQGTKDYFATADQWSIFGNIVQVRELSGGVFAALETGKKYYVYNVGMGRYLTKGEAYGTQAVVGNEPMRFVVNHSAAMPEGVYYLTSEDTGKDGKYLFRTTTDGNVGRGVQATFVDGVSLSANARWNIQPIGDDIYTFQIPSDGAGYAEGMYWGVQTDHASDAASPTYGVYSDIDYATHTKACQWRFVLYDEEEVNKYKAAKTLESLLAMAVQRKLSVDIEQAIFDNFDSSIDELKKAQKSLRRRLGLIEFANEEVRRICISLFDANRDEEISYTEASQATDFDSYDFYRNTKVTNFDEFQYFTTIPSIYGNSFETCSNLESIVLPDGINKIYYRAFYNCRKLKAINLPAYLMYIGEHCFANCVALREVTVANPDPASIQLGDGVFSGVKLSQCTLYVPVGTKELYAEAEVWKDFGSIVEIRTQVQPKFSRIEPNTPGYVYNLGMRMYLNKGEAYGTQSVVARSGMLYEFRRSNNMADGVFYLYSGQTGKDGKYLFRTDSDTKVGEGVKACFVDGSLSEKAYWQVKAVTDSIYTLQVPKTDATYVEDEYLGTKGGQSVVSEGMTYGTYWFVKGGDDYSKWAFVTEADMKAAREENDVLAKLKTILEQAVAKEVDVTAERAVYDNIESTKDELKAAWLSVREKLHFITFADAKAQDVCVANWDADFDGELTYEEAAAVTDIGEHFRGITTMKYFEELKYFTSLTEIPEKAFYGASSLEVLYVPASVVKLGASSFSSCNSLNSIVLLNESQKLDYSACGLSKNTIVFVPVPVLEAYKNDPEWEGKTIVDYTGKPVVSAEATRRYGYSRATIYKVVTGAPIQGEPEMTCESISDMSLPVGEYPITVSLGTISTPDVELRPGVFSITPTTLTVTASSYTRNVGESNPDFELTYKGFRNKDTEDVLIKKPVASCLATQDSPAGVYDIIIDGGEAQNYVFEYVNGTLTIVDPDGIATIASTQKDTQAVYDLQGRRIVHAKRGLYISKDRKVVIR